MSKFNKQQISNPDVRTAAPPPDFCQKDGCTKNTTVAFMRVFNKNTGKTEIGGTKGAANEVNSKRGAYAYQSNGQIAMNDKYDYIGWVTRCGGCYQQDLAKTGNRAVDICRKQFKEMNTIKSS